MGSALLCQAELEPGICLLVSLGSGGPVSSRFTWCSGRAQAESHARTALQLARGLDDRRKRNGACTVDGLESQETPPFDMFMSATYLPGPEGMNPRS